MLLFGGVIADVKSNSYDILNERVVNRRNYIQNEMIHRWSNLSESEAEIVENIQAILTQNGLSASDIQQNVDLNIEIVEKIAPKIIYMLRKKLRHGGLPSSWTVRARKKMWPALIPEPASI